MDDVYNNANKFSLIGYEYLKEQLLSNPGLYNYINNITPTDTAKYLLILIIVVIITNSLSISPNVIIGLIIGLIIIYYMIDKSNTLTNNLNKKLDDNLIRLDFKHLDHIYKDIDILNIYSNIVEYKKYNKPAFNQSLKHMDNMIKIHDDLKNGVKDYKQNLDIAEAEGISALNSLTSIIITIPVTSAYDKDVSLDIKDFYDPRISELSRPNVSKLKSAITLLRKLVNKHINDMADICYNRWTTDTITTRSAPIDIEFPRPFVPNYNNHYEIYV